MVDNPSSAAGAGPRASKILLVEDDDDMRQMVAAILLREGYEVVEASGGRDAARHLAGLTADDWARGAVDLVLSDIRMAEMDGLHLVNTIREAQWPVPVILMSAFPDAGVRAAARQLRAVLLPKPFAMDTLRRIVAMALPGRRAPDGPTEEEMS